MPHKATWKEHVLLVAPASVLACSRAGMLPNEGPAARDGGVTSEDAAKKNIHQPLREEDVVCSSDEYHSYPSQEKTQ
jgi:hypothetical protein